MKARKTILSAAVAGASFGAVLLVALAMYGSFSSERPSGSAAPVAERARNFLHFAPGAPQLAYLNLAPVEEIPEPVSEPLPARIAYDEDVTARVSSPIAGRVLKLLANPGDTVKAGQPLLLLDAPEYGAAVADAAKARAAFQRDDQAYQRARLLFDAGVLARRDVESAEAERAQSLAEDRRANARLRNLAPFGNIDGDNGEHFTLRAPISGILVDRQVNPGTEVRPDAPNPLFVITNPRRLWVLVDLPERDLGTAHIGQAALLETDALPGERFEARIAQVSAVLDPNTRRIPLRLAFSNRDGRLRPEMFARVTLVGDPDKKVIRVPNTAVMTEGVNQFVFVAKTAETIEKRPVKLAQQSNDYSVVAEGLHDGERIVTKGALLLNSEFEGGSSEGK